MEWPRESSPGARGPSTDSRVTPMEYELAKAGSANDLYAIKMSYGSQAVAKQKMKL